MNKIKSITLTVLLLAPLAALPAAEPAPSRFQHFITRQGDKLMDGDKEFRFIGACMPGLTVPYDYTLKLPERLVLPTPWEQEDAFKTLGQMGLHAVRFWPLPVRQTGKAGETWHHVQGPDQFNEDAFVCIDRALALANRYGVRVIFPFIDNYDQYLGAWGAIAAHRGKDKKEFWTDDQLKADYQAIIRHVLNRRNTVTGQIYRDDPAILCWELGNELSAPPAWRQEMAAFIKSLDSRHMVMSGPLKAAPDPNVDIYSPHYYPRGTDFAALCRKDRAALAGKRPLVIGEFGPYVGQDFTAETLLPKLREFLTTVIESETSGAMLWSMYFHKETGGFYWHQVFTYPSVWSYHWPGFPSAEMQREQGIMAALREAAFKIQGLPVPPMPVPDVPKLLPIGDVPLLSWRGSAGASGYDIERAPAASGPWKAVSCNVSDADVAYRPLFSDETVAAGDTWFYRVIARNESGTSNPSNVVGPVAVKRVCLVDELQDFSRVHAKSDGLKLNNGYNSLYAEYLFRAQGKAGEWVTYRVHGDIVSVKVVAFYGWGDRRDLTLQVSPDGMTFANLTPELKDRRLPYHPNATAGSQGRTMVEYECAVPPGQRQLKIVFNGPAEVDRVEIYASAVKSPPR